jgi:hypothetical protein
MSQDNKTDSVLDLDLDLNRTMVIDAPLDGDATPGLASEFTSIGNGTPLVANRKDPIIDGGDSERGPTANAELANLLPSAGHGDRSILTALPNIGWPAGGIDDPFRTAIRNSNDVNPTGPLVGLDGTAPT